MRSFSRATVVGSSMRRGVVGTRAAASSRSVWIAPGTARAWACSGVSRTTMRPIGLSSRTTSPTSVIQVRVVMPASRPSTRKAGTGRPADCTTSRAWTSRVIGALRRVAGSKTETCSVWPGWRPRAARTRGRLRERAGGSSSSRVSFRSPEGVRIVRSRRRPSSVPRISVGPVPASSANENRWSAKARSTVARLVRRTRRAGAEEGHLQPAVLPHLVAGVGGRRLADREADLVAAVVDAAPLRRGAVVREVRGQGHGRGRPGPAGEHPHLGHPRHEDQGGQPPGGRAGQRAEELHRGARASLWLMRRIIAGGRARAAGGIRAGRLLVQWTCRSSRSCSCARAVPPTSPRRAGR